MNAPWLPPLVFLEDCDGDWPTYEDVLYRWFRNDFVESTPQWPGKRVGLKRHPMSRGKEATFWHFIQEGKVEDDRTPDLRRCERIRWPRPIMEAFPRGVASSNARIRYWRNRRGTETRFVLALPDFSYVVIVADRGEYVLPWTAYCVEREHQRQKLRREFEAFWKAQNS
jgi:hypothetical protein